MYFLVKTQCLECWSQQRFIPQFDNVATRINVFNFRKLARIFFEHLSTVDVYIQLFIICIVLCVLNCPESQLGLGIPFLPGPTFNSNPDWVLVRENIIRNLFEKMQLESELRSGFIEPLFGLDCILIQIEFQVMF